MLLSKSMFPVLTPELDVVLQVWTQQYWVEGKDHLPGPEDKLPLNAAQDTRMPDCGGVFLASPLQPWCLLRRDAGRPARQSLACCCLCVRHPFCSKTQLLLSGFSAQCLLKSTLSFFFLFNWKAELWQWPFTQTQSWYPHPTESAHREEQERCQK